MSFQFVAQQGKSDRTLVLLHGTGGDEHSLLALGSALDPAASLFSVRGRIDEHGQNRFFRRFQEGIFDLENLASETESLAQFLAGQSLGDDAMLVGFSNGANMAASLLIRHPELFSGGILLRPMVTFQPDSVPSLQGIRVLIASGERDPMVPRESAEGLAAIFVEGGADVEHIWTSGGHNLARSEIEHAAEWLKR